MLKSLQQIGFVDMMRDDFLALDSLDPNLVYFIPGFGGFKEA